jgi:Flp pilus assembly protein TadD
MKYLSLHLLVTLTLSSLLLLSGGCARQARTVAFAPISETGQSDQDTAGKLENMPLETLVGKGINYLEQGNFSLARLHLLKALTLDRDNVEIYGHLGELFLKMEKKEKALTAFAAVLKSRPDNVPALLGIGKLNRLKGDFSAAEEYLMRAQAVAPEDHEVLTELAICYDSSGQEALAEMLYLRVTELQPGNHSSFNNLGFHYLIQGTYPQAIAALLNARKLKLEDRVNTNNLAAAYILSGDNSRGLALFENSIGKAGAMNNVGYIHMIRNEWWKAEAAFKQALELSPRYYVKAARNLDYLRNLLASREPRPENALPVQ